MKRILPLILLSVALPTLAAPAPATRPALQFRAALWYAPPLRDIGVPQDVWLNRGAWHDDNAMNNMDADVLKARLAGGADGATVYLDFEGPLPRYATSWDFTDPANAAGFAAQAAMIDLIRQVRPGLKVSYVVQQLPGYDGDMWYKFWQQHTDAFNRGLRMAAVDAMLRRIVIPKVDSVCYGQYFSRESADINDDLFGGPGQARQLRHGWVDDVQRIQAVLSTYNKPTRFLFSPLYGQWAGKDYAGKVIPPDEFATLAWYLEAAGFDAVVLWGWLLNPKTVPDGLGNNVNVWDQQNATWQKILYLQKFGCH